MSPWRAPRRFRIVAGVVAGIVQVVAQCAHQLGRQFVGIVVTTHAHGAQGAATQSGKRVAATPFGFVVGGAAVVAEVDAAFDLRQPEHAIAQIVFDLEANFGALVGQAGLADRCIGQHNPIAFHVDEFNCRLQGAVNGKRANSDVGKGSRCSKNAANGEGKVVFFHDSKSKG